MAEKKPSEVLGGWYKEVIDELEEIADNTGGGDTVLIVSNDALDEWLEGGGE